MMARIGLGGMATLLMAAPLGATDVSLSASVQNQCTLTLDAAGAMASNGDGTVLSSEEAGGGGADLAVVAVGAVPTITFGAPTLSAPAGDSGSTAEISYTSIGGASQTYTNQQTSSSQGILLDAYTVHGRVLNASGFAAGSYTVTTIVTCSQ